MKKPYGHVAYTRKTKTGKIVSVKAKGSKPVDVDLSEGHDALHDLRVWTGPLLWVERGGYADFTPRNSRGERVGNPDMAEAERRVANFTAAWLTVWAGGPNFNNVCKHDKGGATSPMGAFMRAFENHESNEDAALRAAMPGVNQDIVKRVLACAEAGRAAAKLPDDASVLVPFGGAFHDKAWPRSGVRMTVGELRRASQGLRTKTQKMLGGMADFLLDEDVYDRSKAAKYGDEEEDFDDLDFSTYEDIRLTSRQEVAVARLAKRFQVGTREAAYFVQAVNPKKRTIRLHRGSETKPLPGDVLGTGFLSSWTASHDQATYFGSHVVTHDFPLDAIAFAEPVTPLLGEHEYVVRTNGKVHLGAR